jgi:hypothetical protein
MPKGKKGKKQCAERVYIFLSWLTPATSLAELVGKANIMSHLQFTLSSAFIIR